MVGSTTLTMPPRSSLTSSFSVSDTNNEVVCPLRNQDGSSCRKRCLGVSGRQEKRYRSMQEHIRRAHPQHYIAKLPATEESFQLMITTPPSDNIQLPNKTNQLRQPTPFAVEKFSEKTQDKKTVDNAGDSQSSHAENSSIPNTPSTPKSTEEYQSISTMPVTYAAVALAQLHRHKMELDQELAGDWMSDTEAHKHAMRHSIELPPPQIGQFEPTSDPFSRHRRRELLPSVLTTSPPERSSTLPPIQRNPSLTRPRKDSVSQRAREPQHKKHRSRGENGHLWRVSFDRKAMSAEPSVGIATTWGKRWEDLIDAATSATTSAAEDNEDERRQNVHNSGHSVVEMASPAPTSNNINSLPSFMATHSHLQRYQASPLQRALTPPLNLLDTPGRLSSTENGASGGGSGDSYHSDSRGPSHSSLGYSSHIMQIYCAACQGLSLLRESYVCTECISGICVSCVEVLMSEQGARRKCPKCATIGGRYKKINLDVRV
ncbi:unnamed protein product [Blumeria hordei]|uniref:RING zinc finger-like domain-containing protein n=1 Tax=Blumeria hordei TaxID=2867405 RepID=A0A383URX2_BLUHO|nr:unnamed protein product [Blumeria hordei]